MTALHGSVRGVRTFRLTRADRLAPVTARPAWHAGVNTAVCDRRTLRRRPTPDHPAPDHRAPAPGCTCGLWACGSPAALREAGVLGSSRVLAVVAAHGQVIPATRGFRAEHARIEALWLSPRIDPARRTAVARAYPGAAVYATRSGMLSEHPLTHLPTYALPRPPQRGVLLGHLLALAAWPLLVAALWVAAPAPDAAASTGPLVTTAAAQLAAVSVVTVAHFVAATATLLLSLHSRWWRATLVTLVPQTVLLLAGQLLLDDVTAWVQLAMAVLSTSVLHLAAGVVFAWRLHWSELDHRS